MHTNHSIPYFPIIPVKLTAIQQHYNTQDKVLHIMFAFGLKKDAKKKSQTKKPHKHRVSKT